MQLGAVYPQIELRGAPEAVRRIGLAVESLGYDYLLTYDHVVGTTHDRERTAQDRSAQEVAARIRWCREFGCTHVAVDSMNKGFATAQAHIDFLGEVRQRLGNT